MALKDCIVTFEVKNIKLQTTTQQLKFEVFCCLQNEAMKAQRCKRHVKLNCRTSVESTTLKALLGDNESRAVKGQGGVYCVDRSNVSHPSTRPGQTRRYGGCLIAHRIRRWVSTAKKCSRLPVDIGQHLTNIVVVLLLNNSHHSQISPILKLAVLKEITCFKGP